MASLTQVLNGFTASYMGNPHLSAYPISSMLAPIEEEQSCVYTVISENTTQTYESSRDIRTVNLQISFFGKDLISLRNIMETFRSAYHFKHELNSVEVLKTIVEGISESYDGTKFYQLRCDLSILFFI